MKRRWTALFILPLLLLSGCRPADVLPYAREVERMALMRTLGVDAAEDGVRVTVASGVQSKGADKGEEPPLVLSRTAGTVSGACLAMQSYGTSDIFYGHVGQLLLGESLAEQGLAEALDYVERDPEMRLDTDLFIIKNATAEQAIFATAARTAAPADRLDALEADAGLLAGSMPRSVKDVLSGLARDGASFAPAVTLTPRREGDGGAGEEYDLNTAGYAVFKEDTLAGWAEGDAARGVNLLLGQVEADLLELNRPEGRFALRVVGARTRVRPVFDGATLSGLEVRCGVEANIAEAPPGLELSEAVLDALRAALETVEEGRLRQALTLAQTLDADFLGLCRQAGLSAPWHWADLQTAWPPAFAGLPIQVEVSANIQRSYDVK